MGVNEYGTGAVGVLVDGYQKVELQVPIPMFGE